MRRHCSSIGLLIIATLTALLAACGRAPVDPNEIRIGFVFDKTGPLEAYMKQTQVGFQMGLDYATDGTFTVAGKKLRVIERDSKGKPDVAKAQLAAAYADDKVALAIGAGGSGVSLAMLPVAEDYRRLLIIEPAVADTITGAKWNRYVFRTARNSSQDAIANAKVHDHPGTSIATLAQDNAFGRDGIRAFKAALQKAQLVHEEFLPPSTNDFTAGAQRIIDALKDRPGRKIVFVAWAGATSPFKIADLNLARYGIEIATGGNILPAMAAYKAFPGMEGATYYYYGIPRNPINDELVRRHQAQFNGPPDFFTAGGFAAAMAVVTALKKTNGDARTETLIAAMRGMSFDTPKGVMRFREEDHQAMQAMYHIRIKNDPTLPWAVPELVREITPEEMNVPIRNQNIQR
jgi:branched-chain amino acid transport system substrate-binding protein